MLINVTIKWSIETYILDPNPDCPASKCCDLFFKGDFNNYEDVYNFGKKVDIITIEIEHVNVEALYKLEKEGVDVYPSPSNIELIQNKGVQKDFSKKIKFQHQIIKDLIIRKNCLHTFLKLNLVIRLYGNLRPWVMMGKVLN